MFSEKNRKVLLGLITFLVGGAIAEKKSFAQLYFLPLSEGRLSNNKLKEFKVEVRGRPGLLGIPQNPGDFFGTNNKTKSGFLKVAIPMPSEIEEGVEFVKVLPKELNFAKLEINAPEKIELYDPNFNLDDFLGEFRARMGSINLLHQEFESKGLDEKHQIEIYQKISNGFAVLNSWIETYGLTYLLPEIRGLHKKIQASIPKTLQAETKKIDSTAEAAKLRLQPPKFEELDSQTKRIFEKIFPVGTEFSVAKSKHVKLIFVSKSSTLSPQNKLSKVIVNNFLEKSEFLIEQFYLYLKTNVNEEYRPKIDEKFERIFSSPEPFFTLFYIPSPTKPGSLDSNYLVQLLDVFATPQDINLRQFSSEVLAQIRCVVFNTYSGGNEISGQNGVWFNSSVQPGQEVIYNYESLIASLFGEFFTNLIFQKDGTQTFGQNANWLTAGLKGFLATKFFGANPGFNITDAKKKSRYAEKVDVSIRNNLYILDYFSHLFDRQNVLLHKTPVQNLMFKSFIDLEFLDIVKGVSFFEYMIEKWGQVGFEWLCDQNYYRENSSFNDRFVEFEAQAEKFFGHANKLDKNLKIFDYLNSDWENWTLKKRLDSIKKYKK